MSVRIPAATVIDDNDGPIENSRPVLPNSCEADPKQFRVSLRAALVADSDQDHLAGRPLPPDPVLHEQPGDRRFCVYELVGAGQTLP